MKKYGFAFLFSLVTLSSFAQDSSAYHFSFLHNWVIKTAPLQLFDLELRGYLEKKITKHFSAELIASWYIPNDGISVSEQLENFYLQNRYKREKKDLVNDYVYGYKIGGGLTAYVFGKS